MTKEDAKRILACRGNGYSEEDFNNAIEVAFNSIPPLPSNVDEAAKKYLLSVDAYRNTDYGCKFDQFDIETFKAGAVWMQKQINNQTVILYGLQGQ